jgi:hypothetical protein
LTLVLTQAGLRTAWAHRALGIHGSERPLRNVEGKGSHAWRIAV